MTNINPWDRITVVLVTRNSEAILPTSLGSLTQARRIILIDAMSTDHTLEVARACHLGIDIINLTEDRGLGAASNMGFQRVKTEYVLNINPDTRDLIETHDLDEDKVRESILVDLLSEQPLSLGRLPIADTVEQDDDETKTIYYD